MTMTDERPRTTRALAPVDHAAQQRALVKDQAEQMLAQRGAGGLFPRDMSELQAVALAKLAVAYRLDPFAEEIILYQAKPYLTLRGAERVANDHPQFDGMEVRPATDAERKAFRARDDEHLWVATVWRKDRRLPFVNYGRCGPSDRNALKDAWGPELAMKRAKHRALRDAFSLPALGIDEAGHGRDSGPAAAEREVSDVIDGELVTQRDERPPLRSEQTKAIHAIVRGLRWTEMEYRELLRDCFGVDSSQDLSEAQAAALLETLKAQEDALAEAQSDERRAEIRRSLASGLRAVWDREEAANDLSGASASRDVAPKVIDVEPIEASGDVLPEAESDAAEIDGEFIEMAPDADPETEPTLPLDLGPAVAAVDESASEPMPSAKDRTDYERLLTLARTLGIDEAPYEIDGRTTLRQMARLKTQLQETCKDAQQIRTGKK